MVSEYFAKGGTARAEDAVGCYVRIGDLRELEVAPGVRIRAVAGAGLMLSYVTLDPNSVAEEHTHDEEQMGIVLSGSCTFVLDGDERELSEGDVYHAPSGVPHGARTGETVCIILDVFSPPRVALLDLLKGPNA